MLSLFVAPEDKDLSLLKEFNAFGGDSGQDLFLGEEVFFKVNLFSSLFCSSDFLVVFSVA